jgi:hypothetical protein
MKLKKVGSEDDLCPDRLNTARVTAPVTPPVGFMPFVQQEYILGMLRYSKPTTTRAITWTKLYSTILLETTIAGLIMNDRDDENWVWSRLFVPIINDLPLT